MAVYVDRLRTWKAGQGPSCHMVADSLPELHEFAGRLGLKPAALHAYAGGRRPHYDLTARRRALAVAAGAAELANREFLRRCDQMAAADPRETHAA
jgi:hypothetical protein